jgi:hypothetical protein
MHGKKRCGKREGRRFSVSEQEQSFLDRLLKGGGHSEEDEVREYIGHRKETGQT